jgi:hypothetical protein
MILKLKRKKMKKRTRMNKMMDLMKKKKKKKKQEYRPNQNNLKNKDPTQGMTKRILIRGHKVPLQILTARRNNIEYLKMY